MNFENVVKFREFLRILKLEVTNSQPMEHGPACFRQKSSYTSRHARLMYCLVSGGPAMELRLAVDQHLSDPHNPAAGYSHNIR